MDSGDVCRLLGLSKRTLQSWRASGRIPFSMLSGKVYFKESDIDALLKNGMNPK
ncbi:MAG: helix-turn-helix domain-containing protein [Rikenellaceae bacterium]|nr:helix-turn-helix domain-containing protein [Rikenellaceae bacterium]MCL2692962.1 helix-turn-helix domain-containing protein [Rikenellaceae bacterium]